MNAEYHLELINNCMHLLVGRENNYSGSKVSISQFSSGKSQYLSYF